MSARAQTVSPCRAALLGFGHQTHVGCGVVPLGPQPIRFFFFSTHISTRVSRAHDDQSPLAANAGPGFLFLSFFISLLLFFLLCEARPCRRLASAALPLCATAAARGAEDNGKFFSRPRSGDSFFSFFPCDNTDDPFRAEAVGAKKRRTDNEFWEPHCTLVRRGRKRRRPVRWTGVHRAPHAPTARNRA
nr:hypothetical protein [Pandoravirus belohorizontensis]